MTPVLGPEQAVPNSSRSAAGSSLAVERREKEITACPVYSRIGFSAALLYVKRLLNASHGVVSRQQTGEQVVASIGAKKVSCG